MKTFFNRTVLSMAIAIFSMFFGAGNVVFPLLLGIKTQGAFGFAFLGLFLTGIGGPLLGLLGATLFQGKLLPFFRRTGKIPAIVLIVITLALLGPLAGIPRCVTVAYAAMASLFASPLWLFAPLFCLIALVCCWRHRFLLPVLGYILSPLLIGCLLFIIYQGLTTDLPLVSSTLSSTAAFRSGITTGYDTVDLIASIYFSAGIWTMVELHSKKEPSVIFKTTLKAGLLGCLLLAGIYLGLTHAAARFAPLLTQTAPELLMPKLALITLGPKIGLVANVATALACLTTVISLTMTISEILTKELLPKHLSYRPTLIGILLITTAMSNFGFSAIMAILHPLITFCYPLIIVLTVVNIFHKLSSKTRRIPDVSNN